MPKTITNVDKIKRIYPLNTNNLKNINQTISKENDSKIQNKWNKNYCIPIVSASLLKGENKKTINHYFFRKRLNDNKNKDIYKTQKILNNILNRNSKNHINFRDNNNKKREMLFNFSDKKAFHFKRNQHLTERNNSINNLINDFSYNYNFLKNVAYSFKRYLHTCIYHLL